MIKSFFFNVLLILGSLAIFTLMLEGGVRLAQAFDLVPVLDKKSLSVLGSTSEEHSAKLVVSKNPVLALEYDVNGPQINRFDMRDRPYELSASQGVSRIVAMGDSVTFGLGVALENTYSKKLELALNQEAPAGQSFQVMNFGVSGYSTDSELELFQLKARLFKPDVVVVGYAMNDPIHTSSLALAAAATMKTDTDFETLAKKSQLLAWAKMNWVKATSGLNAMSVYESFYAIESERWTSVVESMKSFKLLAQDDGFHLVVVVFPVLYDFEDYPFEGYRQQVLQLLNELDIDYIDLLDPYSEFRADKFRVMQNDAWHPNELGHKIAADKLQSYLEDAGLLVHKNETVK